MYIDITMLYGLVQVNFTHTLHRYFTRTWGDHMVVPVPLNMLKQLDCG